MKKNTIKLFALTLATLMIGACHKPEGIKNQANYTFTNTLPEQVNLNFYENREDYSNNGSILNSYQIEPGATATIPLTALKTYWIDWYSNGYSYNNWGDSLPTGNNLGLPIPKLTVASEDDHITITSFTRDTSRSILLNGSGLSSTWKVNVTTEAALNGTHTFTLKKDLSGVYTFTDVLGKATTVPIRFITYSYSPTMPGKSSGFRVIFLDWQQTQYAYMEFRDPGSFYSRNRDSLMTTFSGSSYPYWAIRQ